MKNKLRALHSFTERGEPTASIEQLERENARLERENERLRRIIRMRNFLLKTRVTAPQAPAPTMH